MYNMYTYSKRGDRKFYVRINLQFLDWYPSAIYYVYWANLE